MGGFVGAVDERFRNKFGLAVINDINLIAQQQLCSTRPRGLLILFCVRYLFQTKIGAPKPAS